MKEGRGGIDETGAHTQRPQRKCACRVYVCGKGEGGGALCVGGVGGVWCVKKSSLMG